MLQSAAANHAQCVLAVTECYHNLSATNTSRFILAITTCRWIIKLNGGFTLRGSYKSMTRIRTHSKTALIFGYLSMRLFGHAVIDIVKHIHVHVHMTTCTSAEHSTQLAHKQKQAKPIWGKAPVGIAVDGPLLMVSQRIRKHRACLHSGKNSTRQR